MDKDKIKSIFSSEIFLYLVVGVLTTAINFISFIAIRSVLVKSGGEESVQWKIAELLAFVIAVIFAFIADKLFVFKSYNMSPLKVFSECGMFFGARIISELVVFGIMWFMIDLNKMDANVSKAVAMVVGIGLNYIFSKFIIFKKNVEET